MLWKVTHKLDWIRCLASFNNSSVNKIKAKNKSKISWIALRLKSLDRASCNSNNQVESKAIINQIFQPIHLDKVSSLCNKLEASKASLKPSSKWCNSNNNKIHKATPRIQQTNQTQTNLVSINSIKTAKNCFKTNSLTSNLAWATVASSKVYSQLMVVCSSLITNSSNPKTFNSSNNNSSPLIRFRKSIMLCRILHSSSKFSNQGKIKDSSSFSRLRILTSINNSWCRDCNKTRAILRTSAIIRVIKIKINNYNNLLDKTDLSVNNRTNKSTKVES